MLQIRLNKGSSADGGGGGGGSVKPSPPETVTVACPDHLVLADLPVAKGIGAATAASLVKTVGRRSRRQLGERVHFCVRCDFPIAIYGRLSPCEHAFCLDCARSDSICYLCDERIQKIQTIKMMEGIFICAAPHCLKSFLKKPEFESHIHETHTNLLQPNADRDDGKESDMQSEKARRQQPREQLPPRPMMQPKAPQMFGQLQNYPSDPQQDTSHPPGFDRPGPHNHYHQGFDRQGTPQPESSHYSDKQHGLLSENQFSEYPPVHSMQPPNFAMPMNPNPVLTPYGVPQFPTDGTPPFYAAPYEMARPNSAPDASEQGSLLGFPPGAVGGINYPSNYPQPWNTGQPGMPFEAPPAGPGMVEAFPNYQGDYGRNPGGLPLMPPAVPPANKGMEPMQANNSMDSRDGKGIVAPLPMQVPPPPPSIPPHMSQHQRGKYHSGDMGRDGQGFGWQHENRDSFGSSQE